MNTSKIEKLFEKFYKQKLFIFKDKNFLSYGDVANKINLLQKHLIYKHKSLKNKIVFLNIDRSYNYFIYLLTLANLGATIVPIPSNIKSNDLYNLRKIFNPFTEINEQMLLSKKEFGINKKNIKNDFENSKIIFFSSGTTGKPKGIVHSIPKLLLSAKEFSTLASYKKNINILHNWPHHYMAGFFNMFLCCVAKGSSIVLLDEIGSKNYLNYWNIIKKFKINISYLSPTMAQALITYSQYEKKKFKKLNKIKIITTGSYLYKSIANQFYKTFGINLCQCYGVTEVGGSITLQENFLKPIGSLGKKTKGIKIHLNKNKEIMIKSKFMFIGYQDGLKIKTFKKPYFASGDLGKLVKNELLIIGRKKEIIKKGGEPISLLKIEDITLNLPVVKDVQAKGVSSEFWGEIVELDVVLKKDEEKQKSVENLKKYLIQSLSPIEYPSKINIVNYIPKTSIGKNFRKFFDHP